MLADGMSGGEILPFYPYLEAEDIRDSLRFAAEALQEHQIPRISP
jgi:uncharacterized protein (DUF433 family)